MKKLLCKLMFIFIMSLICIFIFFILIVKTTGSGFEDTYQSVIQRKYDNLIKTNEPKIIIIGGSSAGFGINAKILEQETGYKVANLGLHAGFGNLFTTELMKANINQGDIVVLAYEYNLSNDMSKLGAVDLIMCGIDNYASIYKHIPIKNIPEIIGYLPDYASKKFTREKDRHGVYSSSAFDKEGNMIYSRTSYNIEDYENNKEAYGVVNTDSILNVPIENLNYLKDLKKYVKKKKAKIVFSSPPILKDAVFGDLENFSEYKSILEKQTGIDFISDPKKYIYPSEYMFDTIYHCNDFGEKIRSEQLALDLISYLE